MRDRIWYEMFQVKMNVCFLAELLKRKRRFIVLINSITLFSSFSGIAGWKIWTGMPILACFIICCLSILKVIIPNFIGDEKYIIKIEEVHKFYVEFYQEIEELWFKMEDENLEDSYLRNIFYKELMKKENLYTQKINDIMDKVPKNNKSKKIADELTHSYFSQLFNI